jgi:hypothetical protein
MAEKLRDSEEYLGTKAIVLYEMVTYSVVWYSEILNGT